MDVNYLHSIPKEIKLCLVFFCLALVLACGRSDLVQVEQVDYDNEKAVGVTFNTEMDVENIRVFVGEESQTSVIGVVVSVKDKHQFTPVIPFTRGQTYTLRKLDTVVLATFAIPERVKGESAALLAIHPKVDTVPENLLKMYFEFDQPMQEVGNALDFITVTNETDGLTTAPFLKLESELWNKERTLLTLWLDPGRIKTDLIPNKERGLPLTAGKKYSIHIDNNWKSSRGMPLKQQYTKTFYVGPRDNLKPNVDEWQLRIRGNGDNKVLHIDFGEPMDAFLAKETMRVQDSKGAEVRGDFQLENNASVLVFVPTKQWSSGNYELLIQSRLEDLAGNNLNRLFDTDLGKTPEQQAPRHARSITFSVR